MADTEELRLALVMSGGLSLAVWMGGVTTELFRLVNADGAYGELLELTDRDATIDVVAGTSAGGLNGAVIAAALAYGINVESFSRTRDLWLEHAAIDSLLRSPYAQDPPSLLDGEGVFRRELQDILTGWQNGGDVPPADLRLDLLITTTTLSGEPKTLIDDLGQQISEVDHRGRFMFSTHAIPKAATANAAATNAATTDPAAATTTAATTDPATGAGERADLFDNHFRHPDLPAKLALAARASASFPGAFEATFVPVDGGTAWPHMYGQSTSPDMSDVATFSTNGFVIDGGVLVNKPIEPALRAIFNKPTQHNVRRVLCFVEPNPQQFQAPAPARDSDIPSVAETLLSGLVMIPRVESIGTELEQLKEHNERVRAQQRLRERLLLELVAPSATDSDTGRDTGRTTARRRSTRAKPVPAFQAAAPLLYRFFKHRGAERSVRRMIAQVTNRSGAMLLPGDEHLIESLIAARQDWLPEAFEAGGIHPGWDKTDDGPPVTELGDWVWGIASLEYGTQLVWDLVRRAHAADTGTDPLTEIRAKLSDLVAQLRLVRELDDTYWSWRVGGWHYWMAHCGESSRTPSRARVGDWAGEAYNSWPVASLHGHDNDYADATGRGRTKTAQIVHELRGSYSWLPELDEGFDQTAAKRLLEHIAVGVARLLRDAAGPLRTLDVGPMVDALVPSPPRLAGIVHNLLALYVSHRTLSGEELVLEQPVELVHLSANTSTEVDARATAHAKLAGVQLGHFGAFFKRSWRANDWMWGRLDAAQRLALILVDPVRLRARGLNPGDALAAIEAIATGDGRPGELTDEDRAYLRREWEERYRDKVARELSEVLPGSGEGAAARLLPESAKAVAHRLQVEILIHELWEVSEAVATSAEEGGALSAAASEFRRRVRQEKPHRAPLPASAVRRLLQRCTVGSETIAGEVAHDQFTRVASQALAIGATSLSGKRSGIGPLRHVFKQVRVTLLALHVLVDIVTRRSKVAGGVLMLAIGLSGGVVGIAAFTAVRRVDVVLPALVVAFAVVLVQVLLLFAVWRAARRTAPKPD